MPKNNKPKVCFFNSTKAWGGGEKWHFDMASKLHKKGYEILFIANKDSQLAKRLYGTSIPIKTVRIGNLSFLNIIKLSSLKNLFIKEQVDVIVMNLPSDIKAAGIAARQAGVKRIIYRRGSAVPIKNSFLNRYLFGKVLTDVIANSEATKNTILERNHTMFPKEKIKVIYNGLDFKEVENTPIKKYYKRNSDEIIVGNVGRMVFQKGHEYILDIAKRLQEENIKFKMLLGGSGPLEEETKRKANELGVFENIVFLGFVDNVKSFMHSIDVFLLTSRWEGFGFVLAEAMSASKPIVAFDISSNPELVSHGVNGFLAMPFNTEDFTNYLITLIKNPALRENFGSKGYQIVHEKFDIDRVVREFEELISLY